MAVHMPTNAVDLTATATPAAYSPAARRVASSDLTRARLHSRGSTDDYSWSVTLTIQMVGNSPRTGARQLSRAQSTESTDSACSSIVGSIEKGQNSVCELELRLQYDLFVYCVDCAINRTDNALRVTFLQAVQLSIGQVGPHSTVSLVAYLRPHSQPLWHTQVRTLPIIKSTAQAIRATSAVAWHEQHFQVVRPQDLCKLTLHVQLVHDGGPSNTAAVVGDCKIRMRDIALTEPATLWVSMHQKAATEPVIHLNFI